MSRSARWCLAIALTLAGCVATLWLGKLGSSLLDGPGQGDQWAIASTVAGAAALSIITALTPWAQGDKPPSALPGPPADGPAAPVRIGVVPQRADCYQHREIAEDLRSAIAEGGVPNAAYVLAGTGGVGKTQLAARYAEAAWADGALDILIWVNASSREEIVSAYALAGNRFADPPTADLEHAAARFLTRLQTDAATRWLVVLDDVADAADLRGLWPPRTPQGRLVVTTRNRDAALLADGRRLIDVDVFTRREAADYLADKFAAYRHPDDPDEISKLAAELGHLPLALSQAAAALRNKRLSCAVYRRRLADRHRSLQMNFPPARGLPDEQRHMLAAAWSLSIEYADHLEPRGLARPMLEIASMLDANGIPESVLTGAAAIDYLEHRAPTVFVEIDGARDTLWNLHQLSLIEHNPESANRAVRVHNLIQRSTREALSPEIRPAAARAAADALLAAWPEVESDRGLGQVLRTNATALIDVALDTLCQDDMHPVLTRAGGSLLAAGMLEPAASYFEQLLEWANRHLGRTHPDTFKARRYCAKCQGSTGDINGAVTALTGLLADCTQALGADHRETLKVRHELIWFRWEQGRISETVEALDTLFHDQVEILGSDHKDVLDTRHNLAAALSEAGFYERARRAYELLVRDQVFLHGPDHPDTFASRHNIGWLLMEDADAPAAIEVFEALVQDRTRIQGRDHPDTLIARRVLARLRGMVGDPDAAVRELTEILDDDLRVRGADAPETLKTRASLATWTGEAGHRRAAVDAFRQLVHDEERVQGCDDPDTLTARRELAHWLGKSGDAAAAIAALEALLPDIQRVLGTEQLETLKTRAELAEWQGAVHGPAAAIAGYLDLEADYLRIYGPDSSSTKSVRKRLAEWRMAAAGLDGDPPTAS